MMAVVFPGLQARGRVVALHHRVRVQRDARHLHPLRPHEGLKTNAFRYLWSIVLFIDLDLSHLNWSLIGL